MFATQLESQRQTLNLLAMRKAVLRCESELLRRQLASDLSPMRSTARQLDAGFTFFQSVASFVRVARPLLSALVNKVMNTGDEPGKSKCASGGIMRALAYIDSSAALWNIWKDLKK